jgi:hypothetical protein
MSPSGDVATFVWEKVATACLFSFSVVTTHFRFHSRNVALSASSANLLPHRFGASLYSYSVETESFRSHLVIVISSNE